MSARYLLLGCLVLILSNPVRSQRTPPSLIGNLPALNTVQTITLSPSYSCNWDLSKGYGNTALFLSEYSKQRNSPELLFNGACRATDSFDVNTNGDEMSLIADLGGIPLASLTAQKVFNLRGVNAPVDYTKFTWLADAVAGHTYAVVINNGDVRGLLVFTVLKLVPNRQVDLQYVVKNYQVSSVFEQSQGFTWSQ